MFSTVKGELKQMRVLLKLLHYVHVFVRSLPAYLFFQG